MSKNKFKQAVDLAAAEDDGIIIAADLDWVFLDFPGPEDYVKEGKRQRIQMRMDTETAQNLADRLNTAISKQEEERYRLSLRPPSDN
jgi:hypothetical protein